MASERVCVRVVCFVLDVVVSSLGCVSCFKLRSAVINEEFQHSRYVVQQDVVCGLGGFSYNRVGTRYFSGCRAYDLES